VNDFFSLARSFVCLFVFFGGVVERRSYETFGEELTTLKLNDLDTSLRLILDVEFKNVRAKTLWNSL